MNQQECEERFREQQELWKRLRAAQEEVAVWLEQPWRVGAPKNIFSVAITGDCDRNSRRQTTAHHEDLCPAAQVLLQAAVDAQRKHVHGRLVECQRAVGITEDES